MPRRNHKKAAQPGPPLLGRADRSTLELSIVAAAAFALYLPTLWNGWVTDDESEVLTDVFVRSFTRIPRMFAHSVWFFAQVKASNYYRPLKLVAYSLEYHLFGFRPVFWHLTNVVLNVAVVVAIYLLVKQLSSRALAFWTALLFAFHAVHAEAVAWVAAGNDLLCALFLLLSLWCYHQARSSQPTPGPQTAHTGARRQLALRSTSVLLFLAALFSKETALTFPAVLLCYDLFYRSDEWLELARRWRGYLAYWIALAVYLSMRFHALHGWAPQTRPWHMTAWSMVLSVPVLAASYLRAVLFPTNLNYWHIYHPIRTLGWESAGAAAICLLLLGAMFKLRRHQPLVSFALAWFWLTLVPVLDIPKVGQNVFAERYLYIPSFGFCLCAAYAWLWMRSRARYLGYFAIAALFVFYGTVVFRRLPFWRNTSTMILRTAQQSPDSPEVNAYVSELYKSEGRYDEAIRYGRIAIQDDPSNPYFYDHLGEVYMFEGRYDDALVYLDRAVDLQPDFAPFWVNIGAVYNASHQWQKAEDASRHGLSIASDSSMLLDQLGIAMLHQGRQLEAVAAWRRAVQLSPDDLESHVNLATYLFQTGELNGAAAQLVAALRASPSAANAFVAHFKLGNIYELQSLWQAAADQYQAALQEKPGFEDAALRLRAVEDHLPGPR